MKKLLFFTFCLLFINISAQTFIKHIGTPDVNDGPTSIYKENQSIYIAGYSKNQAYLCELNDNGEMLWRDDYDFTEQIDYVTEIVKTGNKLIGCGYGYAEGSAEFLEFYFKYDINSKSMDWVKKTAMNLKPANIQLLPNGNYLITGDEFGYEGFKIFLMEVEASNGKTVRYASHEFSGAESAATALVYQNHIYTGGRYGLQKKIDKYRGAISKFDFKFDEVWSNYYLNYKEKYLRNYLAKLIIDDGALISLFFTNNHGVNSAYTVCLAKQDLDGTLIWANEYILEAYQNLTVRDVKASENGYYIYGFTKSPTEELFLINTDKEGNALWAKTYGETLNDNIETDQGNYFELDQEFIYMIGQTQNISNKKDYDGVFLKLKLDGNSDQECWEKDVAVNTRPFQELIQGEIFLSKKDSVFKTFNQSFSKVKYNAEAELQYICSPQLAFDDYDTIKTNKGIFIDFLANDFIPKGDSVSYELISNALYGTAKIVNKKIVYIQRPELVCRLDSFKYRLYSELSTNDTGTVYIYTLNSKDILPDLVDQVLPLNEGIILNAESKNASYLWSTGDTAAKINVSKPGAYTVSVTRDGCVYIKTISIEENPYSFDNVAANNITFLLDISSSMNKSNRLPILKNSLFKIMGFMRLEDKLSIIKFAAKPIVIFDGVNATEIEQVKSKVDSLTNESRINILEGIKLAVETSKHNFSNEANNRIIFTTDGDIPSAARIELIDYMKKYFPKDIKFSIFLFNDASIFKTQMKNLADAVNGKLYIVNPENVEEILLQELKERRR